MARPYDPREEDAQNAFRALPAEWQEDEWIQTLYQELMDPRNNWDEAHTWYDSLKDYVARKYDADWDDYFDWKTWRRNYNRYYRPHLLRR